MYFNHGDPKIRFLTADATGPSPHGAAVSVDTRPDYKEITVRRVR
jgi:hypothetical protein